MPRSGTCQTTAAPKTELRVQPQRQAEQREERVRVEEERELAHGSWPPSGLGLYCPKAGEPLADIVGMTREFLQPMPGPHHHSKMSSRPRSHMSKGGIDWVASSRIRDASASMS